MVAPQQSLQLLLYVDQVKSLQLHLLLFALHLTFFYQFLIDLKSPPLLNLSLLDIIYDAARSNLAPSSFLIRIDSQVFLLSIP